ncbi:MAG: DUF2062 domain-containing protein [Verrucomicrobia bacterium]|nr:DUF2062 domain-containing protein [Verrucomicrobiota bacterium]
MWHYGWHRLERSLIYNVIRLFRIRKATEHVARGFAIGVVVNFFPTFGFGPIISGFLAKAAGGSAIAGLIGGAALAFFWPALFYLNMRTGSLFLQPRIVIDEFEDVTPKIIDTLVWGRVFTLGAVLNTLLVGGLAYCALLLMYHRIRPGVLDYFRRHARDHQRRFRRHRPKPSRR